MTGEVEDLLVGQLPIGDRAVLARRLLLSLHDDGRAVDALAVHWFETPAPSDRQKARITWWLSEVALILDVPGAAATPERSDG